MPEEQNLEAQQPEENQERPEWLPDNFKTPEDLAKSYGELQSKFTQTSQQLREQQEQFEGYLAQQEEEKQQEQWQAQAPQYEDQLAQAYEQNPLQVMAWLAEQSAQRAVQSATPQKNDDALYEVIAAEAERQLTARYDDWGDYAPKVAERIQQRADLYPEALFNSPQSTTQVLDEIYKSIKYDDLASGAAQARQQGADQRLAKQQAQTLSGAAGRPDAPSDDEEFFAQLKAAHEQSWSARRNA